MSAKYFVVDVPAFSMATPFGMAAQVMKAFGDLIVGAATDARWKYDGRISTDDNPVVEITSGSSVGIFLVAADGTHLMLALNTQTPMFDKECCGLPTTDDSNMSTEFMDVVSWRGYPGGLFGCMIPPGGDFGSDPTASDFIPKTATRLVGTCLDCRSNFGWSAVNSMLHVRYCLLLVEHAVGVFSQVDNSNLWDQNSLNGMRGVLFGKIFDAILPYGDTDTASYFGALSLSTLSGDEGTAPLESYNDGTYTWVCFQLPTCGMYAQCSRQDKTAVPPSGNPGNMAVAVRPVCPAALTDTFSASSSAPLYEPVGIGLEITSGDPIATNTNFKGFIKTSILRVANTTNGRGKKRGDCIHMGCHVWLPAGGTGDFKNFFYRQQYTIDYTCTDSDGVYSPWPLY